MQLPYEPSDPHIYEDLLYIALNAVEAPQTNTRIQLGSVTLSCTANTLATASVTFGKQFKKGSTPTVLVGLVGNISGQVTPSVAQVTPTTFQAQAYSATTQSVTLSYIAIGQV